MPNARTAPSTRKVVLSALIAVLVLGTAFFIWTRRRAAPPAVDIAVADPTPGMPPVAENDAAGKAAMPQPAAGEPATAGDEEPAPAALPMLRGRVTGEGVGIAGATIMLFSSKGIEALIDRLEELAPEAGELPDFEPIVAAVRQELDSFRASGIGARSMPDGAYEFRDLQPASYFVLTLAEGWLFRYGDVVNLAPDRTETLDLALDRGASISGRVVGRNGEPLAKATVLAEFRPANMAGLGMVVRRLLRYVNGEFLKGPFQTTTGDDGGFTIPSLPPGMYDVAAYQIEGVEARAPQIEAGAADVIVVLGSPAGVRARFADRQGKPASDLPVRLELKDDLVQLALPIPGFDKIANTVNRFVTGGPRKTETDARGALVALALSPGKYKLSVDTRGFLPLEKEFELDWGQTLDLGLINVERGASIEGYVRAIDGRPLEGAKVLATPAKPNPLMMGGVMSDFATGRSSVTTGADGSFRLRGLVKGHYRLTALCAGFAPAVKQSVGTADEPVTFELNPGVRISGRVLSAADSSPIAGARISVQMARTRTDADGNFLLDGVAPRDRSADPFAGMGPIDVPRAVETVVEVEASAPGFLRADEDVDLAHGAASVDILMRRTPQVAGIVLDPEGKPAAGALVRITPLMPDMPFDFFDSGMIFVGASVSDLEGKFLFKDVKGASKKGRFRIIADHALHSRGASEPFAFGDGLDREEPIAVEVKLVRGARIHGVVTDGARPVSGAAVRLARAARQGGGREEGFGMFLNMLGLPKGGDLAYTNKEGRFEHNRILPGDYVLTAELAGFMDSPPQQAALAPGDERELSFVVDPGGEIHGLVLDRNGSAIPGARVRLFKEAAEGETGRSGDREMLQAQKVFGGSYKSTRAGESGEFRIPGLPPSLRYTLAAEHPGFVPAEAGAIAPGAGETRIVLERAAALAGLVLDSGSGAAVTTFRVMIEEASPAGEASQRPDMPGAWLEREINDPAGRFERHDLRPGALTVRVRATGYAPDTREVFVTAAGRVEQVFHLAQAGRIRGVVIDQATQRPIAGVRVRLSAARGGAPVAEEPAGAERRTRRVRDRAERQRRAAESTQSDDEVMGEQILEEWEASETATTGEDGTFLLEDVPAGPQRVKATHGEYIPAVQEPVEVALGTEVEVKLALRPGFSIQGVVRDAGGNPAPSRLFQVRGTDEGNAAISRTGLVGPDGKFYVGGLEKGAYRIRVPPQPGKKVTSEPVTVDVQGPMSDVEVAVIEESEG